MKFPSASQSGIKVNIDPPVNVVTQLSADLTLDFDLTKSFVFNGPPAHSPGVKRVLFKPVIRAINTSEYGRIKVNVFGDNGTPSDSSDDVPLEGATVTALDGTGAEQAVTATNASGLACLQLFPDILQSSRPFQLLITDKTHTSVTEPFVSFSEFVIGSSISILRSSLLRRSTTKAELRRMNSIFSFSLLPFSPAVPGSQQY